MDARAQLRLLYLTDMHYCSDRSAAVGSRHGVAAHLGRELVARAIADARRRGGFDVVVVGGDVILHEDSPTPPDDTLAVRDEIRRAAGDAPVLVVPGNHDLPAEQLLEIFADRPGLHEIGGYRLFTFVDVHHADYSATRPAEQLRAFRQEAARSGGPIVALQHNPVHPPLDDNEGLMLRNRSEVIDDYRQAGVLLSVSGHYHTGREPSDLGGVRFVTVPGLASRPYQYALVYLRGRDVDIQTHRLLLPDEPPLVDGHVHTEMAYCGADVTAAGVVERAEVLGLAGVVFAEHAPQLYVEADAFWAARHVFEPALWRRAAASRMGAYRALVEPLRSAGALAGLEVELDVEGRLTLHEQDRAWTDRILGAIHWLPDDAAALGGPGRMDAVFMRTCRGLCEAGIDVMAHPLRLYSSGGQSWPRHLYPELTAMLAQTHTAAEINLHKKRPDEAFFAACLDAGVKIALGSDAHKLEQVGALQGHLEFLRSAAGREDVGDVLYG